MKGGQVVGDGSWTLAVFVTDLQVERRLRVHGGLHIGGVMIKLVDELGRNENLWNNHFYCSKHDFMKDLYTYFE